MSDITARSGNNRIHVTANFLQSVTPGWVGCENPIFFVLSNYWMNSPFTSWPPLSTILYIHIVMLPGAAMFETFKNDLWMNSFLVKLHDLNV